LLGNILEITSLQNSIIKDLVKTLEGKNKNKTDVFICEGEFFLKSAFENNWEVQTLIINSSISFNSEITKIIDDCILKNVRIIAVNNKILTKLSNNKNPQNLIFTAKKKTFLYSDLKNKNIYLAVDGVMDPGNLGSIFRTINAFGVDVCILVGNTVDQYKKDVVRASMGSLFNLKIIKTNFGDFKRWVCQNSIKLYGTDLRSKNNYFNEDWKFPLCLVLGNENNGISEDMKNLCYKTIFIKTKNNESLNLSVANGIILSEIYRKYPI